MMRNELQRILGEAGFKLSERQLDQVSEFYELFTARNRVMNLSAVREPAEILVKHFLDSFFIGRLAGMQENGYMLDLGTGGGFPGIPLKIEYPGSRWVFLDSTGKKLRFIGEALQRLELGSARVVHARAENAAREPGLREKFDTVFARGVAYLPELVEYALPFLEKGGILAAAKGSSAYREADDASKAIELLGGELLCVKSYKLPGIEESRYVVLVKKKEKTPYEYPRKPGIPRKKPLGI